MTNATTIRFWQPVPDLGSQLMAAYIDAGAGSLHVHEEWQLGVLESDSRLSIGAFRRHSAQPHDVTVVHPYDVHMEGGQLGAPPRWGMLYIAPSLVRRWYGDAVPQVRQPVVTDAAAAGNLRELLRRSGEGLPGSEFLPRVAYWMKQFLGRHAENLTPTLAAPTVERARHYLQARPTQSVTLAELGADAGVTLSHLVRSFSRSIGLPPRSYHLQVRLARARRLLAEGKSATWVAYECGFADQSHLSRRFKECHGITPGAFQTQYLTEPSSALAPNAA
jgi:AraC-like DNA-binding protein